MSSPEISSLSDAQLRARLTTAGATPGPVTVTTRKLLEKKLTALEGKRGPATISAAEAVGAASAAEQARPEVKKPSRKSVGASRSPARQSTLVAAIPVISQEQKLESPQTNRRRTIGGSTETKTKLKSKKVVRRATLAEAKNLAPFSSDEEDNPSTPETNGSYLVSDMKSSPIIFPSTESNSRSNADSSPSRLFPHNKTNGSMTQTVLSAATGYVTNSENIVPPPVNDETVFKRPSPVNKRGLKSFQGEFSDSEDMSPQVKNHKAAKAVSLTASEVPSLPSHHLHYATKVARSEETSSTVDFNRDVVTAPPKPPVMLKPANQPILKPVSTNSSYDAHIRKRRSVDQSVAAKLPEIRKEISSSISQIRQEVLQSISNDSTSSTTTNITSASAAPTQTGSSDEEEEIDVEFTPRRRLFDFSFLRRTEYVIMIASLALLLIISAVVVMSPSLKPLQMITEKSEDGKQQEEASKETISKEESQRFLECLYEDLSYRNGRKQCGEAGVHDSVNKEEMLNIAKLCEKGKTSHHYEELVRDAMMQIEKYHSKSFLVSDAPADSDSSRMYSSRQIWKPLVCRVRESLIDIFTRVLVIAIFVGVCLASYFFMKHRWSADDEDTRQMLYFVDKIIGTLKKHDVVCKQNKELPAYLPIPHVRDMLIPPNQRKKMARVWRKAVDFLNSSDSRVRLETQQIAGEDFEVWRWIGVATVSAAAMQQEKKTTPNHLGTGMDSGKCWQGPAFDEIEKVVRMPIVTPTPCLKVRYMHEGPEEKGEHWEAQVRNAVLEKCNKDSAQVLHVFVDRLSTEGCVYVKCDSLDSAGKAFRSIYGNWFDGRLVIVKFVTLARYHQRFPDALHCSNLLQPSDACPSSLQWEQAEISAS